MISDDAVSTVTRGRTTSHAGYPVVMPMTLPPLVAPVAGLSDDERTRTLRHAALREFGETGQRRLAAAHVAIVGAGGLGSPAVLALAAAGIGTLTVIDDDIVEVTNLQRQVMHRMSDLGAPKVDSATRVAADLSPATRVHAVARRIDGDTAEELLAGADVVLDGTDSFASRAAVAAACERLGVPLVWAVVQEFHAQVTIFWSRPPAGHEPIVLSDLHPPNAAGEAPSCAEVGVLGALTLQVGSIMAVEAIKLLTGIGEPLLGRVLLVDALRARHTEVPLRPASAVRPPAAAVPAAAAPADDIPLVTADEMRTARIEEGAILLDVREPWETAAGVEDGAVLIPLGELLRDPSRVAPGAPVVVICAKGMRALRAARTLRERGVEARVLAGGLAAWAGQA